MITPDKAKKICSEYGLGTYFSVEKIPEGVLNNNYFLITETGKYFIKSVREKARERLEMIYNVEFLMRSRGIPAVTMLKTKSGSIFLMDDGLVYTVYPFIEADKNNTYSESDYRAMGVMLGKIHVAGSSDIPKNLGLKQFKRSADQTILEKLKNYKTEIQSKNGKDEIDKQFLRYIDFKLSAYSKIEIKELPNDTLIHGDYHPGNLLINAQTREIIGICDWEKTEFGPRSYELARSLFYSCFESLYKEGQAKQGLSHMKAFVNGYISLYPMNVDEIIAGLQMRIQRMVLSSWIEEKYYKEKDSRANHFIPNEMKLIDLAVNGDLLEKIRKFIS